ncbi:MAG: von Willebrand factor type A domain-containing protein [Lachnospiraceae bacterium]|nr:von Willebrand factor type A domain-containing protein [Lachnospiraceae bacterium]
MKRKKVLAILMAMTMAVSSLTACGRSKTETGPTSMVDVNSSPSRDYEYAPAPAAKGTTNSPSIEAEYYCTEALCDESGYYPDLELYIERETYNVLEEKGFSDVSLSPLSTFGADVDTASYSNMRRFVNSGYGLGDFDGVALRAEEMINYFKYDYKAPAKGEIFGVDATISACPWNKDHKLMVLGINTDTMQETEKPDSNIVFLIDISGSMNSANKLPLLKDSMALLVKNLSKNDKVSIVTYASGTHVVMEGVSGDNTRKINKAFKNLSAGGGTNGSGGIELAYQIAEKYFIEGGNNRVILATDGDFNIGKVRGDELKELISEKKETGVFLSVLGFGMGNYNDVTAETLADSGNGNYSYIDNLTEAKKVLVDEFTSTLYTVAKDTKLQVEFNPAMVSKYRLIGYENRALNAEDFTDDTKDGGELGAGHQVTVIYELELANDNSGSSLKYQENSLTDKGRAKDEWCTLSIAYKDPDAEASKYLEFPIGKDNYTDKPSNNFILATSVAEYAMALNDSSYLADKTAEEALDQAIKNVKKLESEDEIVEEFLSLMQCVAENDYDDDDNEYNWYE